jgi:hypothetical protein
MVPLPNGKDLHAVGRVCSKLRAAAMRPFRLSPRLILEIDMCERLSDVVAHHEAGGCPVALAVRAMVAAFDDPKFASAAEARLSRALLCSP